MSWNLPKIWRIVTENHDEELPTELHTKKSDDNKLSPLVAAHAPHYLQVWRHI